MIFSSCSLIVLESENSILSQTVRTTASNHHHSRTRELNKTLVLSPSSQLALGNMLRGRPYSRLSGILHF